MGVGGGGRRRGEMRCSHCRDNSIFVCSTDCVFSIILFQFLLVVYTLLIPSIIIIIM